LPELSFSHSMNADEAFSACSAYIRNHITIEDLVTYRERKFRLAREHLGSIRRIISYKPDEFAILAIKHGLVPIETQTDHISTAESVYLRLLLCLEPKKYCDFWNDEMMTDCLESFRQNLDLSRAHSSCQRTC
jgi:hypothetical protein